MSWTERAKKLYDKGLSDREIGRRLGISRQGVGRWRLKHGLTSRLKPEPEPKAGKRPPTKADVLDLVRKRGEVTTRQLYSEGYGDVGRGYKTVGVLRGLADGGEIRLRIRDGEIVWRYEEKPV